MFRRKTLTLSFEGSAVRLLSLKGDEVDQWLELGLPEDMIQGGTVTDPEGLAGRLSEAVASNDLPTRRIAASVTGHRAIFRAMSFPEIDEELLDSAIRRKIRQEIPLPEGEMDLSWTIVDRSNEQLRAFVVAIPRTIIDSHMRTMMLADLKPKAMDIGPLALVRSGNRPNGILADLETSNLSVIILQEKVPAIVRTVPIGGQATSPEARLELLAQEVGRTTKFYNESHKDRPLPESTPVLASGGYFNEGSMLERLQQLVPYPVRLPDPPLRYGSDFPMPQYATNLGLALKDL